jgi:hypothetical protein
MEQVGETMKKIQSISSPISLALTLSRPTGTIIQTCIFAAKGDCLVAVDDGGIGSPSHGPGATALRTDATSPDDSEVFKVIIKGKKHVALQTEDGHYVSAVNGGGIGPHRTAALPLPIFTNGKFALPGTVFHMILLGDGKVRLATPDLKHYVSATNGGGVHSRGDTMRTDAKSIGTNERFELVFLAFDSQTVNGPPH